MTALRSGVFVVWMYGMMAVMAIVCAPSLLGPRTWARGCFRLYLDQVFWGLRVFCRLTYEVRGREHQPRGGALIASKHQSMFETLAYWRILDDPAIILKKSLAYTPFFGWYALKLRNIVVDRKTGSKALRKLLKDAKQRAGEGRQVVIFPQGTRVRPGAAESYKPGVIGLYAAMKTPCAPVALNSGLFWPRSGFIRHSGRIVIAFLPPIAPGFSKETFMTVLESRIETASERLRIEGRGEDAYEPEPHQRAA